MIKWLGENGGELKSIFVCNKEDLCVQIRFLSKWGNLHVLEITANSSAVVSTWPVFRVPCY
jgi:hypothetical protein